MTRGALEVWTHELVVSDGDLEYDVSALARNGQPPSRVVDAAVRRWPQARRAALGPGLGTHRRWVLRRLRDRSVRERLFDVLAAVDLFEHTLAAARASDDEVWRDLVTLWPDQELGRRVLGEAAVRDLLCGDVRVVAEGPSGRGAVRALRSELRRKLDVTDRMRRAVTGELSHVGGLYRLVACAATLLKGRHRLARRVDAHDIVMDAVLRVLERVPLLVGHDPGNTRLLALGVQRVIFKQMRWMVGDLERRARRDRSLDDGLVLEPADVRDIEERRRELARQGCDIAVRAALGLALEGRAGAFRDAEMWLDDVLGRTPSADLDRAWGLRPSHARVIRHRLRARIADRSGTEWERLRSELEALDERLRAEGRIRPVRRAGGEDHGRA